MTKTFADLKRDLTVNKSLKLIYPETHKFFGIERYIIKNQTNGVYLAPEREAKKGSFMDLPVASLVEYDGETLSIFDIGQRDLTPGEKKLLDNKPSKRPENAKKIEIDLMTDSSQMFWTDKAYFRELDAEYLSGHDFHKGLRYDWNTGRVCDKKIKGKLCLQYKLIGE